ncbi:putative acyl-CoA dehydrogenase [Octadecabacter antarcticus 307]|uniref:Putative acyl-CoA dehydrogenase n=1 Tax=Octadecabacter antarcticus 307 TaxID=391626 RepID=M9R7V9_9RHOB|nr:acyl-CoA dehydrogenase family protein [Octadecabacter antarcticus]AGI67853.1 putative acyl-CoA dehydrogenase [Octadecabacter antarcticus 307]
MTQVANIAHQSESIVDAAKSLTKVFAERASGNDENDRFVADNYADLKTSGLISAGVPSDLGGGGASIRELCDVLKIIAGACGSTGLALSMHTHQVAVPAWRWYNQEAARDLVAPLLRRVAEDKIVLLSSGGSDWIGGSGVAEKVEGGYRITARKMFSSGAPAGDLLMTGAISEEDGARIVLHFGVPMAAPEVTVLDTWRTLGMRGTGSHDIKIDGLFIPDDKIPVRRKAGEWHPAFHLIATIAFPLIYSAYLGVAQSARDIAIDIAKKRPVSHRTQSIAGRMDTALTAAHLARNYMIDVAERNAPSAQTINDTMIGRRLVEEHTIKVVELAMELAGGLGFYRKTDLERRFRDIQAARYHPLQKDVQSEYVGAMALGHSVDHIF